MSIASNRIRARAFTLLEVTLAVAILALMSLAIFRFVQSNIISVRISSQTAAADARYDGLRELLLAQLQSLPPGKGALMGEDRPRPEITWACGPGPGVLTRYAPENFSGQMELQQSEKDSNQLDLVLQRWPKDDPDKVTFVPLIKNVRSLQIEYFDPRLGKGKEAWVKAWRDTLLLPRLVKVTIGRSDAPVPWEVIIPLGRTPY